jgi:hypothetical protein
MGDIKPRCGERGQTLQSLLTDFRMSRKQTGASGKAVPWLIGM